MSAEQWKHVVDITTVISTGAMAIFTAAMAWATYRLERVWLRTSTEQLGVKMWLALQQRFDSQEMKQARRKLAQQLSTYSAAKHGKVSETVLNFFEDVGTLWRKGYLDKDLAASAFSFHVCRWWEAAKHYVDQERKRQDGDDSLFEEFEAVAKSMRTSYDVMDADNMKKFFTDEITLE